MNMNWKDMTTLEKAALIFTCIVAVFVVVANRIPGLFPINITYPAIALVTAIEAAVYWKKQRKWAYLLIAGAVICLAFFLMELFLL